MSGAEQWDKGFATGMTDARRKSAQEMRRAIEQCRALRGSYPYAQGYLEGVKHANLMDGKRSYNGNERNRRTA